MNKSKELKGGKPKARGFRDAALFTVISIVAGFAIELLTSGGGITIPQWPVNFYFLAGFAALTATVGLGFRDKPVVSWLGGIPVGLSLILGLAILSLLGGVLPQDVAPPQSLVARLRLNGMFTSWPFAFVTLLFLFNLGISLLWKTVPFKLANLQFMLFHGGFWIALSCGLLGSSDLQRLVVPLYEGKNSDKAYDRGRDTVIQLPFAIYLSNFEIDEYVPQFALYDPETDQVMPEKSKMIPEVRKGAKAEWPGYASVTVLDYLPNAIADQSGNPVAAPGKKGVPYAKLRVVAESGKTLEQWITTGGPGSKPQFIPLGSYYIVMAEGAPKVFRSNVLIDDGHGEHRQTQLEVNKPVDFHGWKLYQMGYDEKAGRWSTMSLVEAVRDPWLPAVYCGFFMIMAGNVLFFWKGVKKMEEA